MTLSTRLGAVLQVMIAILAAGPTPAAPPAGEACLRVKGWETLPDMGRLCAYLADPDAVDVCEQRGYRLGDGVTLDAASSVQQYVLLCQNEYVIEVRRYRGRHLQAESLLISTALLETSGRLQGEYTRGRVLRMTGDGPAWRETAAEGWSNYQEAGPDS